MVVREGNFTSILDDRSLVSHCIKLDFKLMTCSSSETITIHDISFSLSSPPVR